MDIRKEIFGALTADSQLIALLPKGAGSVYMNSSTDETSIPSVVISIVDEVPSFADDDEIITVCRFQVTIITSNAEYDDIEDRVQDVIYGIGATRVIATEFLQEKKHYRVLQYKMVYRAKRSDY